MTDITGTELAHYGKKGMKWGVRKAENAANRLTAESKGYSKEQYAQDQKQFLAGGAKRVANKVAAGQDISKARAEEYAKSFAVGAAILATPKIANITMSALRTAANNREVAAGAKAAAKVLADTRGLTAYSTMALKFVNGVWQ